MNLGGRREKNVRVCVCIGDRGMEEAGFGRASLLGHSRDLGLGWNGSGSGGVEQRHKMSYC
jgi:hypothetical protein